MGLKIIFYTFMLINIKRSVSRKKTQTNNAITNWYSKFIACVNRFKQEETAI